MANSQNVIRLGVLFVILLALQVLVFNNLNFLGYVNPYPYILLLLTMPFGVSTAFLMVVGFVLGFSVDMFCNTPGMHAGACVLLSYVRPYILKFISLHDDYKIGTLPTLYTYDASWYLKYVLMGVGVHHVVLFAFEQIDTILWWPTLLRMLLSAAATVILIYVSQFFVRIGGGSAK